MTDETPETTDDAEEILFYADGKPLKDERWSNYSSSRQESLDYLALKQEIEGKMAKGEPVYVQIMDERRRGSVGRLETITFDYRPAGSTQNYWGRSSQDFLGIRDVQVVWDKRKNKVNASPHEVEYLPNWSGGTQWYWHKGEPKEKVERVVPYDHLNQEIEAGQFVCFVHRRYGNISMKFGTVTRLTDKGSVFVKTLKLKDGQSTEEVKALAADDLIIVNDKLMARLMMARLSAD